MVLIELVQVIDSRGRTLSPCRRKVAEREVRLDRAKWIGRNKIRLRFDPFAYRYIRLKVLARDDHTCYWCGNVGNTMDHVIPWSKGGRTTMNNCICACEECNGARGDMPAEEFARLRNVPPPKPEGGVPTRLQAPLPLLGPPRAAAVGETAVAVAATSETGMGPSPTVEPAVVKLPKLQPAVKVRPGALADLLDPLLPPPSLRLFY